MFDTDKSGSIDYHELKVAIRALGFDVKKEVRAPPACSARAPAPEMPLTVAACRRGCAGGAADHGGGGQGGHGDHRVPGVSVNKCVRAPPPLPALRAADSADALICARHTVTEKISSRDPDEEIAKAFGLFDDDGTGVITLKNMRRIARDLGENLTDDELQAMIDEFDRDQDGAINTVRLLPSRPVLGSARAPDG